VLSDEKDMASLARKLMKYGVSLLSYNTKIEEPEIKWYVA